MIQECPGQIRMDMLETDLEQCAQGIRLEETISKSRVKETEKVLNWLKAKEEDLRKYYTNYIVFRIFFLTVDQMILVLEFRI